MKLRLTVTLALAALAAAVVAAGALGGGKGRLYEFRGELTAASSSSVQLQVQGGNHAALKALIGSSQTQTFAIDSRTEIVLGGGRPHRGDVSDLRLGDQIVLRIRSSRGASLADVEGTPAKTLADHSHAGHASGLLYLYVGTVGGAQPSDHVSLHVTSGNWRGLQTMLGQSLDQTFATDDGTIYLLWQGRTPTVIDPSQLKAGDRITVRVRAKHGASLAQVEATAANHVGDHEPGNPETEDDD
jgi:hypothetical protein